MENAIRLTIQPEMEDARQVFAALASVLPPQQAIPSAEDFLADPVRLRAVLNGLESLLKQGDINAISLFKEHQAFLQAHLGAPYESLARQIIGFEFIEAHETLRALRQRE